jgi:hypothetical protein
VLPFFRFAPLASFVRFALPFPVLQNRAVVFLIAVTGFLFRSIEVTKCDITELEADS